MTDEHTAELFGLDPDQKRGHRDVPLDLDLLGGQIVNVDDGSTIEPAHLVVDPDLFARAAWMKREGERMVRTWRSGHLKIWSPPLQDGYPATVEITNEEGITRREEILFPVYKALTAAQRQRGANDA